MCEILISYTRIQTNQVFILQVFSDILVHLKIVSTNVTHQPSLCYYPCVKDVSCIELSNVWKILNKKKQRTPEHLQKTQIFFRYQDFRQFKKKSKTSYTDHGLQ